MQSRIVKHKGSGTIIFVDDEAAIRTTARKILESLGYAVVCKNDGKEAIDFYINETKSNHQFAAMIFDLTIRDGMGGVRGGRRNPEIGPGKFRCLWPVVMLMMP